MVVNPRRTCSARVIVVGFVCLNVIACLVLLDKDVSVPGVVVVNDPARLLSESSAEDELELDLFDTASQVGDSLARLDIGCGVKKFRKSIDMVPHLNRYTHGMQKDVVLPVHARCQTSVELQLSSQCMHPWSAGNGNGRQL